MTIMKKLVAMLAVAVTLLVSVGTIAVTDARCEETTVSGTVMAGSTTSIIKLNTPQGEMLLKLDSSSDLSKCKNMMPGRNVICTITYADGYWHIKSVKEGTNASNATVDTKNLSTVTGKAIKVDNNSVLYFDTEYGQMQIKLDAATDYSKCTALLPNAEYTMKVAYGSDSYMHAVSIADGFAASAYTDASKTSTSNVKTDATVKGKIDKKSTNSLLILNTEDGQMQIKLDQYNGPLRILVQDQTITVGINYGNEYWHAITIN